jgi:triosephosphate isomerase
MQKNKILIVANWKLNPESLVKTHELLKKFDFSNSKNKEIVICPPAPFIIPVVNLFKKNKKIKVGAQNISEFESGAYTGEFSAKQVASVEASYVIIGHSERRKMGETNDEVAKKVKIALRNKLIPIVCIGESVRDEKGQYHNFIQEQLLASLLDISKANMSRVVIAYEPIWAIGKDASRETTKEEALEMNIFIKKVLADKFGKNVAENAVLLYGGSVNEKNCNEYLEYGRFGGLLVGGASLDARKFNIICK